MKESTVLQVCDNLCISAKTNQGWEALRIKIFIGNFKKLIPEKFQKNSTEIY